MLAHDWRSSSSMVSSNDNSEILEEPADDRVKQFNTAPRLRNANAL